MEYLGTRPRKYSKLEVRCGDTKEYYERNLGNTPNWERDAVGEYPLCLRHCVTEYRQLLTHYGGKQICLRRFYSNPPS